jgi:integrase
MLKVVGCRHLGDGVNIEISKRGKPKLEVGRHIPTPHEVARLVQAAKGKVRVLLMTAASTGLRASELRGLRWHDVDLKAGELHVRQRADAWNTIGSPKSDGSRRTVPLGRELLLALKEWKLACPKGGADLVFPTSTGAVQHHKNMLESIEPVMKAAAVVNKDGSPKYALHAFRHFFASWCINPKDRGGRELPAKVVQSLLGHSSIMMTLDTYGHLFKDGSDRAELDATEKALFG